MCSKNCTYEGCLLLNRNMSQKTFLFNKFYGLRHNEQQQFLAGCVDIIEPQRRYVPVEISTRKCTVKYSLPTSNITSKLQVCQKQTISTLDVTKRRLQMLVEKLKSKKSVFDERGTHSTRPRNIRKHQKELVEDHIRSFPCQESHYSRYSSKTMYLNPDLNIATMFKLFKIRYPETSIKPHTYTRIFREKFHIKFGLPRSDACKTCDKYFIQMAASESEEEIKKLETESEIHHRKAEKAYNAMSTDTQVAKENPNFIVVCVDLQQVIATPNLKHSDVYYQRQLSNYNFCIHNLGKNEATMCVWNESCGKRGASEIVSCILHYIVENFQKLLPHETRSLVIWSDRCVGQNNNWKMVGLCHYLVILEYFTEVNQKFLVTGHSFLPCDRDFALIEKRKKTAVLHVPDDVISMICNARDDNPFKVQVMGGEFVDFTPVEEQIFKHPELKISDCRWIQFSKDSPTEVRTRKCHNTLEGWKVFNILKKKGRGRTRCPLPNNSSIGAEECLSYQLSEEDGSH